MSIVTGSTTGISPIDTNSHTVSCLGSDVLTRSERLINVLSFDEDGACHSYEVTVYIRTIPSRPSQGDIRRQLHRFRWGTLGHRFTSVRCVFCWLCLSTNTCIDGTNHASHMSARNVIWRERFFLTAGPIEWRHLDQEVVFKSPHSEAILPADAALWGWPVRWVGIEETFYEHCCVHASANGQWMRGHLMEVRKDSRDHWGKREQIHEWCVRGHLYP